ncbi:MAG: glycoside hydrolase family 43 protein [Flavitalea sp.]
MQLRLYRNLFIASLLFVLPYCSKTGGEPIVDPPPPVEKTFYNPLMSGSDPWVIKKDNLYFYTHTLGNRVALWKTTNMSKIGNVSSVNIYTPAAGSNNSSNVWAPEIHYLDNKWYVYYTAGSGPDNTQRTWVLENSSTDPTIGQWVDKGRIFAANADFWAIDGTVLEYNGSKYFLWSGRPIGNLQDQHIYIAKMLNPWTIDGDAVMLTSPLLNWERNGGPVNEAPQILKNEAGKIFLVYSASGCWTDEYALGMLTLKDGGDPLKKEDWTKADQPVFRKKPESNAYGPGHNAFFKSPDGKENWIIYHANTNPGEGCGEKRNIRIQKFTFNSTGVPVFGEPTRTGSFIPVPSGE